MTVTAMRTYLEMVDQASLRPASPRADQLTIARVDRPSAALWRYLYTEVGRDHRWFDRLSWTDEEAQAYLDDPAVTLWLASVDGETAGYFELRLKRAEPSRSSTSACCRTTPDAAWAARC